MRTLPFLPMFLLATTACGGSNDAVWLFMFGLEEVVESTSSCQENFFDAACPTGTTSEPSPWTFTEEHEVSNGALFGQILDGPSGQKLLVLDGDVFVGEKNSGTWEFRWDSFDNYEETLSHQTGYTFKESIDRAQEVLFSIDLKGGEATGTLSLTATEDYEISESDSWDAASVGFSFGMITSESRVWLEGNFENPVDVNDCADAVCRISTSSTFTARVPVTGLRTGDDGRSFDGVRNAGQNPGI